MEKKIIQRNKLRSFWQILLKLVVLIVVLELLLALKASWDIQRIVAEMPKVEVKTPIKPVIAKKPVVKHKKVVYVKPTGQALEIAIKVSKETGVSQETISRIMFAESEYIATASHLNKNKTRDHGYFQINDIHISTAKKMGIDIFTPEGNAEYAIYLIKTYGLSPWSASKSKWNKV